MIATHPIDLRRRVRRQPNPIRVPQKRPSILDPHLESEPWLDYCPCSDNLVLFSMNYPIAVIPGSPLEFSALSMRLSQLRRRWPR